MELLELDRNPSDADVCLLVEGAYPFVPGGVASWIDWLMKSLSPLRFSVIALVSGQESLVPCFEFPPNMVGLHVLDLSQETALLPKALEYGRHRPELPEELARLLEDLIVAGDIKVLRSLIEFINSKSAPLSHQHLLNSRLSWDAVCLMYKHMMPHTSFFHYFWAWRAVFGGLFAILKFPLPRASIYHAICTGYAGMLAARAAIETRRPVILTEHGIYTNERRIEILMAEWVADTIDKGLSLDDHRIDIRDIWMQAFDAYARCCYDACSTITTLYEDNRRLQVLLGADARKTKVIANGIETTRYNKLPRPGDDAPPTIALIGRVVPIKDVKTYISAAALVRERVPDLKALVIGPTEEDPTYARECFELVADLKLENCVIFTGRVRIADYLPKVHVVALTSLSEAQPLVLLEAGAASIPCVASDVGACREILEGRSCERPHFGPGGLVTMIASPEDTAQALCRLLLDKDERRRLGAALRERVHAYYGSERAVYEYKALYKSYLGCPETGI